MRALVVVVTVLLTMASIGGVAIMRSDRALRRRMVAVLPPRAATELPPMDELVDELSRRVERLQTELGESRAEERRFRAMLDHLQIGIVVVDPLGSFVIRNEATDRLIGTQASDAMASSRLQDVLLQARNGLASTQTLELFGPPHRIIELHGSPLASGAMVVVEDLTERRRIDAIRRDFVSNIGHELRTPVGALAVLAETLTDSASDEDPEVVRRLAGRIDLEAHRLTAMVDDLLSLAGIEADDPSQHRTISVNQVAEEAVDRVASSAQRRGVPIEWTPTDADLWVHGDRRQLVSAVHNLLENAVKYSDKGAPVRLDARSAASGSAVEIRVIDRGIGIPMRDRERIFERFYRVDRARARDTGGTGLGLAIVRHVAVNHGGDVHVESLEGQGSTFALRLPAVDAALSEASPNSSAGSATPQPPGDATK